MYTVTSEGGVRPHRPLLPLLPRRSAYYVDIEVKSPGRGVRIILVYPVLTGTPISPYSGQFCLYIVVFLSVDIFPRYIATNSMYSQSTVYVPCRSCVLLLPLSCCLPSSFALPLPHRLQYYRSRRSSSQNDQVSQARCARDALGCDRSE